MRSKDEKIKFLLQACPWCDETELKQMTTEKLDELIEDACDESDWYPNGRDTDAEDEDWP
jgi:hypothetical protein